MACVCISVYRKERLDEFYREILRRYQKYVIEDTCWFSIDLEWHMKPTYAKNEIKQITEVFGSFPEQEILIFGECDRIFIAAHEIIAHFGGLLSVNIGESREEINSYKGRKIEINKIRHKHPEKYEPDYWLVDHFFVREYFAAISGDNFERFKLGRFLYKA